jgi:small-conductance mechanosensitive channel
MNIDANFLDLQLFTIAGTTVTVATAVTALLVLVFTFVISRISQRALGKALRLKGVTREGNIRVGQRLLHYFILAVGFAVALDTLGIHLSALFAAGAIAAIALGIAMQNISQNFVAGVILLLERSIKPGDVLDVEGRFVRVEQMGVRATIARTLDDEELIMPNSILVQSNVTNYTLKDSSYRLRASVGVVYSSDMSLVRATLEEVARGISWRRSQPDPMVLMTEFGNSAVVYEVSVWVDDPWQTRRLKSDLHEAIWLAFKERNIVIAFPQLDLHLDTEITETVRALRPA